MSQEDEWDKLPILSLLMKSGGYENGIYGVEAFGLQL